MGYRLKPFTMSVRNNSTQEFVDVGLLGTDVDADVQAIEKKTGWFVAPETYGAKGDGTTDDTLAFTTASSAGIIRGSKGKTYYVNQPTISNSVYDCTFKIKKEGTILVNGDNVEMSGNEFFNDELDTTTRGKWLIAVVNSDNFKFCGNYIHDAVSSIYLARCKNSSVCHNVFEDISQTAATTGGNGYGVMLIQCEDIDIVYNKFLNVARHAIYLSLDDTPSYPNKRININHNSFVWDSNVSGNTTGFETTMMIRPSIDVDIDSNTFDGVYNIAVLQSQVTANGDSPCENIKIRNNVLKNCINPYRQSDGYVNVYGRSDETTTVGVTELEVTGNIIYNRVTSLVKTPNAFNKLIVDGNIDYASSVTNGFVFIQGTDPSMKTDELYIRNNIIRSSTPSHILSITLNNSTSASFDVIDISNNIADILGIYSFNAAETIQRFIITGNVFNNSGSNNGANSNVSKLVLKGNTYNARMNSGISVTKADAYDGLLAVAITPRSSAVTLNTGFVADHSTNFVTKQDGIVYLQLDLYTTNTLTIGTEVEIGSLPVEFYPHSERYYPCYKRDGTFCGILSVYASGLIKYTPKTSDKIFGEGITMAWAVKDG